MDDIINSMSETPTKLRPDELSRLYIGIVMLTMATYPYLWLACWLLDLPHLSPAQLYHTLIRDDLIRKRGIKNLAMVLAFKDAYLPDDPDA